MSTYIQYIYIYSFIHVICMWGDMAIQIGDKKSWDMVWIITNEQPRSSKKHGERNNEE